MWIYCSNCGNAIMHCSEWGLTEEQSKKMYDEYEEVKDIILCNCCAEPEKRHCDDCKMDRCKIICEHDFENRLCVRCYKHESND